MWKSSFEPDSVLHPTPPSIWRNCRATESVTRFLLLFTRRDPFRLRLRCVSDRCYLLTGICFCCKILEDRQLHLMIQTKLETGVHLKRTANSYNKPVPKTSNHIVPNMKWPHTLASLKMQYWLQWDENVVNNDLWLGAGLQGIMSQCKWQFL
jgi:hypothetical protein